MNKLITIAAWICLVSTIPLLLIDFENRKEKEYLVTYITINKDNNTLWGNISTKGPKWTTSDISLAKSYISQEQNINSNNIVIISITKLDN